MIPYGVDKNVFHPPEQGKESMKQEVDKFMASATTKMHRAKFSGNFCAAVIGMNQGRKNLGAAYYAWKEFESRHDDVCLFMLTHPQAPNTTRGTYDLGLFADIDHGIILYTTLPEPVFSRILVSCDCLIHPSIGEGFGLPVLEALSSGVIPIVTNFSAVTDFCTSENSFPVDWTPIMGEYNTIRAVAHEDAIVASLESAYAAWKSGKINSMISSATETASRYSWDTSAGAMARLAAVTLSRPAGWSKLVARRVL
jgi:glycosyltransferase involved in cell wall biosynthesis